MSRKGGIMKKMNNAILKYILPVIVFAAVFHAMAWASDANFPNYVRLSSGFYQPAGDLDDTGYDPGVNIGAVFGRYFGKHLVLEGGLDFFYTENDTTGSAPAAGFYTEDDSLGVFSVTATAKGVYPVGRAEFYGGGGIGVCFVSLYADITAANLGDVDTDEQDSVFGVHAVGGLTFNITERFLIGGEVKYLWTDDVDISKQIWDIPIRLQGNLDGYSVNFTFGFRF